ncbi:Vacuolar protein sorting-associated protein vps5, partial [Dimargaris cristalligena]
MGLSADLPSLTVDTANSSDPSSIMERLASIEIGPNSPLPGGSHSGGLSSPQFAEAEPPVDALRSPAQSPLSHGLGLPDHLDPATTLDLNSVRLETGANSGLPSVSNSSTLESPTTTSNGGLFEITVSDPHKIGDAMSAHVVYKVHTKTSQPGFDSEEYSVRRRYRDFEWLFNQLASTHPGVVIPPMPEKQSLGRFQDDFVESRRFALEKYLRKISVHSLLQADDDFKIFLTSENFTIE